MENKELRRTIDTWIQQTKMEQENSKKAQHEKWNERFQNLEMETKELKREIDTLRQQESKQMDLVWKQGTFVENLQKQTDEMNIAIKKLTEDIYSVRSEITILTKDDEILKGALLRESDHLLEQIHRLERQMERYGESQNRGPLDIMLKGFKSIVNFFIGYKVQGQLS